MKPTKARIEMMQAISDGAVTERYSHGAGYYATWDHGPGTGAHRRQVVTARTREAHRAELINPAAHREGDRCNAPRMWELTPAGEAWLKANGGSTS